MTTCTTAEPTFTPDGQYVLPLDVTAQTGPGRRTAPPMIEVHGWALAGAFRRTASGTLHRIDDQAHLIPVRSADEHHLRLLQSGKLIEWKPAPYWTQTGRKRYGWRPDATRRGHSRYAVWRTRYALAAPHHPVIQAGPVWTYPGPEPCPHPGPHEHRRT